MNEYSSGQITGVIVDYNQERIPNDTGTIYNLYYDIGAVAPDTAVAVDVIALLAVKTSFTIDSVEVNRGLILIGLTCGDASGD